MKHFKVFNPRIAVLLLGLCVFGSGASGLVNEYILSTISTYILGNSIEQFSINIALMMFMMGIAGWVQKFISSTNLIEKFIVIEVILAILCGFAPLSIYAAYGAVPNHFVLIQYFFVSSIGFLIGLEIPFIMRINQEYHQTLKSNLAVVLSLDYIGGFVGAVVWTYFLLKTFPLTEISFLVAGTNFIIAIIALCYFTFHGFVKFKKTAVISAFTTICLLVYGVTHNREWNLTLEQRLYDDPIVFETTTKYQRIVITYTPKIDDYRLYINGNIQFSSMDEARYHELLVHPVIGGAAHRKNVLILGGGDGLALREVLKYEDVQTVTLVELDPDMIKLASTVPILKQLNKDSFADARVQTVSSGTVVPEETWQDILQDASTLYEPKKVDKVASVNVFNVDADIFLNKVPRRSFWDVVIIDFPDPGSIELTKLYSKEFFLKLKRVMAPHAAISIQSTSPYHAKESFLCIGRTIESAGFKVKPYHENIPSFGDWGWFLAWDERESSFDFDKVLKDIEVSTKYLTPEVFARSLIFGKGELETTKTTINTLMFPILLDLYHSHSWMID